MTAQERKAMEMALEALETFKLAQNPIVPQSIYVLRQALAQDHGFDRTASHMAGEYVDTNWDTSDMAHRTGGLSMEQEPVAWWTGKEKSEDEDFIYPKTRQSHIQHPNSATANFYPVPLYTAPPSKPQDIAVGIDVTELGTQLVVRCGNEIIKSEFYHAPKREWVSLTDEEFKFIASKYSLLTQTGMEYFKDELETKLKELNT